MANKIFDQIYIFTDSDSGSFLSSHIWYIISMTPCAFRSMFRNMKIKNRILTTINAPYTYQFPIYIGYWVKIYNFGCIRFYFPNDEVSFYWISFRMIIFYNIAAATATAIMVQWRCIILYYHFFFPFHFNITTPSVY